MILPEKPGSRRTGSSNGLAGGRRPTREFSCARRGDQKTLGSRRWQVVRPVSGEGGGPITLLVITLRTASGQVRHPPRSASASMSYHYFGSGPGGPPGIPGGGMTGVELGCGTGAGFTISGSTPGGGLITPPLLSNLSLRFFSCSSTTLPPCTPPGRGASGRTFSGIV
jgi:hypothetical protein